MNGSACDVVSPEVDAPGARAQTVVAVLDPLFILGLIGVGVVGQILIAGAHFPMFIQVGLHESLQSSGEADDVLVPGVGRSNGQVDAFLLGQSHIGTLVLGVLEVIDGGWWGRRGGSGVVVFEEEEAEVEGFVVFDHEVGFVLSDLVGHAGEVELGVEILPVEDGDAPVAAESTAGLVPHILCDIVDVLVIEGGGSINDAFDLFDLLGVEVS